jgi:four helix bundle protein
MSCDCDYRSINIFLSGVHSFIPIKPAYPSDWIQIRRSSRSITANISEGWGKRKYIQVFKRHLIDSPGSIEETKTRIQFANASKYWEDSRCHELLDKSDIIGAKIYKLHGNWK